MTNYFVIIKDEQSGPYTLDQLKNLGIHSKTMIWYEGLSDWQEAGQISELKVLFQNQPPPFKKETTVRENNTIRQHQGNTSEKKSNSGSSSMVWSVIAITTVIIVIFVFYNQQRNQEQMSWELSRQREQLEEQENERIAEEQRVAEEIHQREYRKLKASYDDAVNNLRRAKIQLDDVASFHLLRTLDEKDAEVSAQLEVVRSWENEVDRLKYKLDNFN